MRRIHPSIAGQVRQDAGQVNEFAESNKDGYNPANGGAKAACGGLTAPFRAVFSAERGGLPPRISKSLFLLPLAILTLFNCEALFDIAPPEIEIIKPREGVSYIVTLPLELRITDNNKVEKVEVFLDDKSVHLFTRGPFNTDFDITELGGMPKTLKVVAHDRAGNWNEAARNFSDAEWEPVLVGHWNIQTESAEDVFVSGNYAYVMGDVRDLYIINVSNPASPVLTSSYNMPDYILDVFVRGNYAYVASYNAGLQIIDISNPASPTRVGSYNTPNSANGIFVSGSYACVADYESGLQIVNVTSPASPTLAGYYVTPGSARSIFISGNYAYVDDRDGLQIINISNPASPSLTGYYGTLDNWVNGVFISGGYAYVANGPDGLQIINISNPASPSLARSYDTPDWAEDVFVAGNYAYVADYYGLQIVDISNPANSTEVGYYVTPGRAWGVFVSGGYAYVADGGSGLLIFDVSGLP